MTELLALEGIAALILLVFLAWAVWMSRRTKRFRAGVFVEREYEEKGKEEEE